jgi:hypothetical protein
MFTEPPFTLRVLPTIIAHLWCIPRALSMFTPEAYLEVNTLAERTSKQPGRARHTTNESTHIFQITRDSKKCSFKSFCEKD